MRMCASIVLWPAVTQRLALARCIRQTRNTEALA